MTCFLSARRIFLFSQIFLAGLAWGLSATAARAQSQIDPAFAHVLGEGRWAAVILLVLLVFGAHGLSRRSIPQNRQWQTRGMLYAGLALAPALLFVAGFVLLAMDVVGGVFDGFKAGRTFADPWKPSVLRLHYILMTAGGLALIFAAGGWAGVRSGREPGGGAEIRPGPGAHQSVTQPPAIPARNTPDSYGWVTRFLHWTIAGSFLLLVPMGILMSALPDTAPYRGALYLIHKSLGVTVLALALARIVWHFVSPRPGPHKSLRRWEKTLSRLVHLSLYALMLGFPISGYLMSTYYDVTTSAYFFDLPKLAAKDPDAGRNAAFVHKLVLPGLFYLLVSLHLLGVLKHQFFDRRPEIFRRMGLTPRPGAGRGQAGAAQRQAD